jgi:uncharacterized protein (TIGR03435 family)
MGTVRFVYTGGRFNAKATTLSYLMEWAYAILPFQHSGGPAWLGIDRYDIAAKAAGDATEEQMKLMTRTLLEERFHLKIHRETRESPVLILSLGKTPPKLFAPKEAETTSLRMEPRMGPGRKLQSWHIAATRFSFAQLDTMFARQFERVIVNRTGMDGDFDFTIDLTPDESRPNPLDAATLMSALREQLGLIVKAEKAPVEHLVIDGAEKVAAGN